MKLSFGGSLNTAQNSDKTDDSATGWTGRDTFKSKSASSEKVKLEQEAVYMGKEEILGKVNTATSKSTPSSSSGSVSVD